MSEATTFVIRVPSEAAGHIHAFYSWIINHIGHNLPVEKTATRPEEMEEIYTTFSEELTRFLSLDRINALFQVTGVEEWSQEQYQDWLSQQTVEIHVAPSGKVGAELSCKVFGPEPDTAGKINIGYEEFYKFYVDLYFQEDEGKYVVNFHTRLNRDLEDKDNIVPLSLGPLATYTYEQNKNQDPLTWEQLVVESSKTLRNHLEAFGVSLSSIDALVNDRTDQLSKLMQATHAATGSFYNPLRYRFVVESLPTAEGLTWFLSVTYSIGRTFSFYLPSITVPTKAE